MWPEHLLVGVTGPECTGKTTLAKELARLTGGIWIPEFARLYLESKPNAGYSYYDFLSIARGQMQQQIFFQTTTGKGPVFFDTDHTVLKIWAMEKYGHFPPLLEKLYEQCRCDWHLLCYPDLPWEADPLRESPHEREDLFQKYNTLLLAEAKTFTVIKGKESARTHQALSALPLSRKVSGV